MNKMDLLIKNANIITMDEGLCIENGCIGITGEEISFVGQSCEGKAKRIIDLHGNIVMPGLVNTHTHMPMSLLRGYADDLPLQEWLFDKIFPIEDKLTGEDAYWGTLLSCLEMIASGTTTFNDMYFHSMHIAKATLESGMRANITRGTTDMSGEEGGKLRLLESVSLYEQFHQEKKLKIDVGLHAIYVCSLPYLEKIAQLAQDLKAGIHLHLSETKLENIECFEKYNKTPAQLFEQAGLFQFRTVAAHCVHLSDDDIAILQKNNVHISHNPCSNLKLASGIAPIGKYQNAGLNVALGTDGASSNNNLNLFKEIQLAATLHKGATNEPTLITAQQALEMATVNGAKALGREQEIGKIKQGLKADMIFINTDSPHMQPLHHLTSSVVYAAQASDVYSVMVGGQFLLENREYKTLDYEKIKFEINKICQRLF